MTYLFVFCRFFINCKEYYLFTALIVTSLPNIASKTSLYLETDWDTLFDRKKIYKLTTMYKIHNNCVQNIYLKLFQIQEVMILHIELEIDSESSEYKDVSFFNLPLLQLIMHTAVTKNILKNLKIIFYQLILRYFFGPTLTSN